MSRPKYLDADRSDRSVAADVFFRQEPDGEEDEDEGDRKEDDDDDEEDDDGLLGVSVRLFGQWVEDEARTFRQGG